MVEVLSRQSLCALLFAAACGSSGSSGSGPQGVVYARIAASDGPCTATQPLEGVPGFCPSSNLRCSVDQMDDLPFARARGTLAVEAASRFAGGNLLAMAWQNADGSVARFQMDVGPNRAYGLTHFPYPNPAVMGGSYGGDPAPPEGVQEAIGYVEWKDGQRVFGATSVTSAILNYGGLFTAVSGTSGGPDPSVMFMHVAFDGVGPAGEAKCRVVGVHALRDYERFTDYDPAWLEPDPSIMLGDDHAWPPSFSGDTPPSMNIVAPGEAADDPGGVAPELALRAPTAYTHGYFYIAPGSSAGDGAG